MRSFVIAVLIWLSVSCERTRGSCPEVVVNFDISKTENDFYAGEGFVVINLAGNASEITWDFGDGTISSDSICEHTYLSAGNYDLILTACNSDHCDSIKIGVTVKDSVLTLLTGNSSKKWNLIKWIDRDKQNVDFDTCFCNYSYTFHSNGELFSMNTGQKICGQDTFQCSYRYPSDNGWFEIEFDPYNRNNHILVGQAGGEGYRINIDYDQLFLESNLSGDKLYYESE